MLERIRLFPILIAILIVFMGTKALDIWSGVGTMICSVTPAMTSGDAPAPAEADHGTDTDAATPGHEDGNSNDHGDPDTLVNSSGGYLSPADVDLMNSMKDRDAKYDAWEGELKMRERMLEVAEGKVEVRIAELRELETTLRSLVEAQSEKEEADLARLVKVYETMKPQDSAPIIQRLDDDTQLAIAGRMKESKLAAIFAKMEDDTPQKLTVRLMERLEIPESMSPSE